MNSLGLLPKSTSPSRVPYPWARERACDPVVGPRFGPRNTRIPRKWSWLSTPNGAPPFHRRSRPRQSQACGPETSEIKLSGKLGGESWRVFVLVGEIPRLRLARAWGGRPDQFRGDDGTSLRGETLPGRRGAHVHRFRASASASGLERDALLRAGTAGGGAFAGAFIRASAVVATLFGLHPRCGAEFATVDADDQRQRSCDQQSSKKSGVHFENTIIDTTLRVWAQE